ncbi:50S ribosomal protein L9 [Ornithobacterium rhinotracheale]|uniref:Large ribosomal subunit protein bL9 n=2 Tax=Ornithobacterium rhinotracheale TaxID=28251 RepID=A0A410JSG3_ORNRH|nr:50S ribosomal protein L9 [Ornithobacterium rhinotracheale]QAR31093.1 50S ribosomal protein L9 [Ornithobacterium rhinotracheale]
MQVILTKDVENLGFEFEVVSVKPGYGRNFLIPQGLAKLATPKNIEELNKVLEDRKAHEEALIAEANKIIEAVKGLELVIAAKVGEGDKLFGSVNNADLTDLLNQKGVQVERKHVSILGRNIKRLGTYTAIVKPHRSVQTEISFDIVPE